MANFKDIVMFSMKVCSMPLNMSYLLNKSFRFTLLDDVVSHKNNYISIVTLTIIYTTLVAWLCYTLLFFYSPPNQAVQFHKKNDWNSYVRNALQSSSELHPS